MHTYTQSVILSIAKIKKMSYNLAVTIHEYDICAMFLKLMRYSQ